MKNIILAFIFIISASTIFAQYKMIIKGTDNSYTSILISNISEIKFVDCPSTVSYEGKIYNTVIIGNQCWLKENLDVGTMIAGSSQQQSGNGIEKYCYGDVPANCTTYGGLYQWNEAMQYSTTPGTQGICPIGWHIPTYDEFQTLKTAVSNDGSALKATGTNTSGFSALLAGHRDYGGPFLNLDYSTNFMSSTGLNTTDAYGMYLIINDSNIYFGSYYFKYYGFSVRCVKD